MVLRRLLQLFPGAPAKTTARTRKPVDRLTAADGAAFPVWEYANDEEGLPGRDETWVRPVTYWPVKSLAGRVAATTVVLADGRRLPAWLGNVDVDDAEATAEFLVLSVVRHDGATFTLARYFDAWADQSGPAALASMLGSTVEEIFPISYDLREVATGDPAALRGHVLAEPARCLTEMERMALIFRDRASKG